MADLLEIAEQLWNGEGSTDGGGHHPVTQDLGLAEVADRTAFNASFGNISRLRHRRRAAARRHRQPDFGGHATTSGSGAGTPIGCDTVVFTHGHIDHVFGMAPFDEEADDQRVGAAARGGARARAAALRPLRPDRGLQRRHQPAAVPVPGPALAHRLPPARRDLPRPPHARRSAARRSSCTTTRARPTTPPGCGSPAARCSAPATCSSGPAPNCGNPQKVQRYPREWAIGAAQDGRARRRGAAARPRPPDRRRRPHRAGARRRAPSCSSRSSSRRSR